MSTDAEITESNSLESQEALRRIAKLDLEKEKLKLEVQSLARQLSRRGVALEWLKSAGVLAALLGVAVTLYVGFNQVRQSEQNRLAERFDKALTRLASEKPNERITGVSALRLFLSERDTSHQAEALHFLVNSVSLETDPMVQTAILDVFAELKTLNISQPVLNATLRTAVERNRSISDTLRDDLSKRIAWDQKQTLASYAPLKLKADQIPTPIPQKLVAKLPLAEYLTFLEAERGAFEDLEPKQDVPLQSLARLIIALLTTGARGDDFSGIYCNRCDFTKAGDLSGVKFDNASLSQANFSHLTLKNASFKGATLSETIFFAADLSNANLTKNPGSLLRDSSTQSTTFFECANLKGADLSGTPLLVYREDFSTTWSGEHATGVLAPQMLSAQIDSSTKLDRFIIIVLTEVSDAYLSSHPGHRRFVALQGDREESVPNLLLENVSYTQSYRRFRADFTAQEAEYSSTTAIEYVDISAKNISKIRPQIKSALQGYLNQPSLTVIPLLAAFNNALGPSQNKDRWAAKAKHTCGETSHPQLTQLRIGGGMKSDDSPDDE
ncbi:MAG TPA: pentapeptide repeat-containing protein [Pyrinomonadaceae bacterium]|nr:pentapeptide repeat-containing protein [Pyrinomonadaceae bacterium]